MLAVFAVIRNFGPDSGANSSRGYFPDRIFSRSRSLHRLMQDSILLRTLQLLTQEEIETLELFVASPIFIEVNRFMAPVRVFEFVKRF